MPIRWKITLWYSTILSIILLVIGISLYFFFADREMDAFDERLKQTSVEVIRSIQVESFPFGLPLRTQLVLPDMDIFSSSNTFLQVIDTKGRIVDRSESLGNNTLPISQRILERVAQGNSGYDTIRFNQVSIRIYTTPIMSDESNIYGILQVAGTLEQIEQSLANLRKLLLIIFSVTILIVGGTAWFLAKRVLRPIDQLIAITSEIQNGKDLKRRIDYDGPPDEIGRLIEQSNHMFERLDQVYQHLDESYQMQKRFVSDASHELRTPLTTIKGNIDFLKKVYQNNPELAGEVIEEISSEADRMARLLNQLLSLARADAGYQMNSSNFLVKSLFEELIPQWRKMRDDIPLHVLHLDKLDSLILNGNRDYLAQLFYILLDNAFKYTQEGSVTIQFDIRDDARRRYLIVRIVDTGIGIPETSLPHIFERFYRGENSQEYNGTGLGLPIAKWIVEQHNGKIALESELGKGTTVTVQLPLK